MANKIYEAQESAVTWNSAGTTELLTATSLAAGAGRQGAIHDFGSTSKARRGTLRVRIVPGATRVVGELVQVYLKTSDNTNPDNDDGTGDIAVSAQDKLRNLWPIGVIQIDENAAVPMVGSWDFEVSARYWAPVLWNGTSNSLSATATDFVITWTPFPDEIQ